MLYTLTCLGHALFFSYRLTERRGTPPPHRGEAERGQGRGRRLRCRAQSHATAEDVAATADLSSAPPSPPSSPYEKAWAESVGAEGPPAPTNGEPLVGKHKWLGGAFLNGQIIGIPAHAEAVIRVPPPTPPTPPRPSSRVGQSQTQRVALILGRQSRRHSVKSAPCRQSETIWARVKQSGKAVNHHPSLLVFSGV